MERVHSLPRREYQKRKWTTMMGRSSGRLKFFSHVAQRQRLYCRRVAADSYPCTLVLPVLALPPISGDEIAADHSLQLFHSALPYAWKFNMEAAVHAPLSLFTWRVLPRGRFRRTIRLEAVCQHAATRHQIAVECARIQPNAKSMR